MKTLKILFVMRSKLYLRNFEPMVRALAEAGHSLDILVSADERKVPEAINRLSRDLEDRFPDVRFGIASARGDIWARFADDVRALRNFLRYLRPEYRDAHLLRERAQKRAPLPARLVARLGLLRVRPIAELCDLLARLVERALPPDPVIADELKRERPDMLLVTPLVDLDSEQLDWVKAARAVGLPSGLCVASWDNLTNKGLVQIVPDRVIVWNEFQKREAVEMHGIPAAAITATGAQLYDQWFERAPTRDREEFCRQLGLDPDRPILLYCGSSIFISRFEPEFVARWVKAVRAADDPALAGANILVRPHPMHQVPYDDLDLSDFAPLAIHPRRGGLPVSDDAKADYFDALHHCAAVVGINTSALIEAAILGKRCFTVNDETNRQTQDGTLHYRYLIDGGPLRPAPDLATHLSDLAAELADARPEVLDPRDDGRQDQMARFVRSFLRPNGLDKAATPALVEAVTQVAGAKPEVRAAGGGQLLPLRWLLWPFAFGLSLVSMRHDWFFDLIVRVLRRGLIIVANLRRRDLVDLVSRPMPLDYTAQELSILATSRQEFVTRSRSVMREPWTVHWIERAMKPGEVLFDIGANIGTYALLCAKVHKGRVKVFAFEPSFSTYNALCRNVMHNKLNGAVTPVPIALSSESAITTFKYRSVDPGSARHGMGDRAIGIKKQKEVLPQFEQTIFTQSLDDLMETYALETPSHMKIDVDGLESVVLAGARKTLSDPRLQTVMVEFDGEDGRSAVVAALEEAGLELVKAFDKLDPPGAFDGFFARSPAALSEIMATAPDRPPEELAGTS